MAGVGQDVLRGRLRSQLLTGREGRSPAGVVRHLLAIQAQDGRGARLAIRARSQGLNAADVDDALRTGELVVSWLNRGTLHLVAAEDYWWLHPLTTPRLRTTNSTMLRQAGVTPKQTARAVDAVRSAVAEGPQTRAALRSRLEELGLPTDGEALGQILLAATLDGRIVRGPMVKGEQAFVSVEAWLGPAPPPLEGDEALALLARRYLAGHAPATAEDLAKWAGIKLADARQGMGDAVASSPESDRFPPPRLLGGFDPLMHGWASREAVVGSNRGVITSNGIFKPVALVEGRVVATWSLPGGAVTIEPLEAISNGDRRELADDASDVLRFLGLPDRSVAFK